MHYFLVYVLLVSKKWYEGGGFSVDPSRNSVLKEQSSVKHLMLGILGFVISIYLTLNTASGGMLLGQMGLGPV